MEIKTSIDGAKFRLKFDGNMTHAHYRELEDRIIDAMRRYKNLEVDLSGVEEIDLCGLHLIGLLQSVATIVATSPVVAQASARLLSSLQSASLGRAIKRERLTIPA
jgi:anti-anti-sigma regulatory factor